MRSERRCCTSCNRPKSPKSRPKAESRRNPGPQCHYKMFPLCTALKCVEISWHGRFRGPPKAALLGRSNHLHQPSEGAHFGTRLSEHGPDGRSSGASDMIQTTCHAGRMSFAPGSLRFRRGKRFQAGTQQSSVTAIRRCRTQTQQIPH